MKNFIKKYHELITIPVSILVWIASNYVLRMFDDTAAVFDAGIFQIPLFGILQFFVYAALAWFTLKVIFSTFSDYLLMNLKTDFKELTGWQRLKLAYSIYFALFFALIWLAQTLVSGR